MRRLRLAVLAGAACLPLVVAPNPAAATVTFTGVRPGTFLTRVNFTVPPPGEIAGWIPNGCTANFVFQDLVGTETVVGFDSSQQLYLGTAGHCFPVGTRVRAAVYAGNGAPIVMPIGTVESNWFPTDDFAIIKLDPTVNALVSPSTAYFGGPTGIYTGSGGVMVTLVGNGGYAGALVPRVGNLGDRFVHTNATFAVFDMPVTVGDSGGPVSTLDDKLAVGENTGLLTNLVGVNSVGVTISRALALSGKALAVCPDGTPWPLPGCPTL